MATPQQKKTAPKVEQQTASTSKPSRPSRPKARNRTTSHRPAKAEPMATPTASNWQAGTPEANAIGLDAMLSNYISSHRGVTLGTLNIFDLYSWNLAKCSPQFRQNGLMAAAISGGGTTTQQQQKRSGSNSQSAQRSGGSQSAQTSQQGGTDTGSEGGSEGADMQPQTTQQQTRAAGANR